MFRETMSNLRIRTLIVMVALAVLATSICAARADEAADAVQVLSKSWKTADGQFVGDTKTFKWRAWLRFDNGGAVDVGQRAVRAMRNKPRQEDNSRVVKTMLPESVWSNRRHRLEHTTD
jgi:hypothetical protein